MKCGDCARYHDLSPNNGWCMKHGMAVAPDETCDEFLGRDTCRMDKGGLCAETGSPCDPSCRMKNRKEQK